MSETVNTKRVGLVLGSGGARGLAHIGVIRELQSRGYEINAVAGSSMGALVGGIFALGKLDEYEQWVCHLQRRDILKLLDWHFTGGGLLRGEAIIDKLSSLLGDAEIESLEVAFSAVAVDLDRGREVWFDKGSLFDAIRSSIAIPGIFTPHHYRGMNLVDGGLLNPIPIAALMRTPVDMIVAVDVNAMPAGSQGTPDANARNEGDEAAAPGVKDKLLGFFGLQKDKSVPDMVYVIQRSLELMQAQLARQNLAMHHPDCVVSIPNSICMIHEFDRADEIIRKGEEIASEALDAFER